MTDEECRELGIMTDQELRDMDLRYERMEETGIADTQKYFDRMHDKLFSLNSLLVAGYFALIAIRKDVPGWSIVIPTINSVLLLYIDYRMMIRGRLQAVITNVNGEGRDRYGAIMRKTNLYSLLSIFSTIIVLIFFGYFLFSSTR
jgi:nitrogen fixation/metabolism regulation signal transduction histidine kinase